MTDLITGDSAGAPANAVGIATSAAYGTFHPSNPMHIAMMRNPQPLGLNTSAVSTTHVSTSTKSLLKLICTDYGCFMIIDACQCREFRRNYQFFEFFKETSLS